MGNPLDNPRVILWIVVAFVAGLVVLFSVKARADQTLALEAGSTVLRGETPTLGFNVGCPGCGPVGTDYEFGFELIGKSSHYRDNPNVIQLHAQIVDGWKRFELGLGFFWQNVPQEYTCDFGFHLLARYRFTDRLAVQWRHSSSAGSCRPNAGRDLVSVGWQFGGGHGR